MKRRVIVLSLLGITAAGLMAPGVAAAEDEKDPIKFCIQFAGKNPTDPRAPGYCLYLPDPTLPQ